MDQRRLLVFKSTCYISSEAEVWVLVDGAWNQGGDVFDFIGIFPKNVRECCGESCRGLNSCEVKLSNVVTSHLN